MGTGLVVRSVRAAVDHYLAVAGTSIDGVVSRFSRPPSGQGQCSPTKGSGFAKAHS